MVRRFMVFLRRLRFLRYCRFNSGFMVFLRRLGFLLSSRFCSGFVVFLRRLRFLLGCRFRGRFVMFLMVNGSVAGWWCLPHRQRKQLMTDP